MQEITINTIINKFYEYSLVTDILSLAKVILE
jgi:hypothetical protein